MFDGIQTRPRDALGRPKTIVLGRPGPLEMPERAKGIVDAARGVSRPGRTTIVAIDGPGGSGKTTLAAAVQALLGDATLVHGDDFYRPMPEQERGQLDPQQGYERYFDWQRLRDQVLAPLRGGEAARYQSYDWATGELGAWHRIDPGTTVIVEGVYSVRPELAPYYHLTAFVDTPRDLCLQRVRARGENSEEWIGKWRAAEDFYLGTTCPQTRVRLLVCGR